MKKLLILGLIGFGLVSFVGADVVKSSVKSIRHATREALTKDLPLEQQLAEARSQIDSYAQSIIRGEVAAENLKDMIADAERDVRTLTARVHHDREALAALRTQLTSDRVEIVPTGTSAAVQPTGSEEAVAMQRAKRFQATSEILNRRSKDVARLKAEYQGTLDSLAKAQSQQLRLQEEVRVLAAEIESLNARQAAARTRHAVGNPSVSMSGFADARAKIKSIRTKLREQNKMLRHFEVQSEVRAASDHATAAVLPGDAVQAIDEVLTAYPAR